MNLPKPLETFIESEMKIRTEAFKEIFEKYKEDNCTNEKKTRQKQVLTKSQFRGIAKLKNK